MSCALSIWHSPDFADCILVMLVSVCVCVWERERERDVYGNYWVSVTSSRKKPEWISWSTQKNRDWVQTTLFLLWFGKNLQGGDVCFHQETHEVWLSLFCDVVSATGYSCLQRCFSAKGHFVLPGNTWRCPVTSLAIPGGGRDAPGI